MCRDCVERSIVEFAEWAEVAEAERLVRQMEIDTGRSIPGAVRPLFTHEIDADVRFADIAKVTDDADAAVTREIEAIQDAVTAGVTGALFQGAANVPGDTIVSRLTALEAEAWPKAVRRAVELGTDNIADILAETYASASAVATSEAARQGVEVEPLTTRAATYRPLAMTAAAEPWTRSLAKVHAQVSTAASIVENVSRETVTETIRSAGTAGAVDKARQAINTAAGSGRMDTADRAEPAKSWASELLDGRTCSACAAVDGRQYSTYEEARADYPNGWFFACKGDARCRGTLVFRYDEPEEGFEPDEDEPAPRVIPEPEPEAEKPTPDNPFPRLPKRPAAPVVRTRDDANAEAWQSNPNRDDPTYKNNCSSCVTVHELRRRGYDVTAAPSGGVGRPNIEFRAWWNGPDGKVVEPEYVSSFGGAEKVIRAEWPDGGRGMFSFAWKGGSGHVMSVEKIDGKVVFTEPQVPGTDFAKVGSMYRARMKPGTGTVTRLDNATPNDKALQAVEQSTKQETR